MKSMIDRCSFGLMSTVTLAMAVGCVQPPVDRPMCPRISGPWWTIARNPNLGPLNGPPDDAPQRRQEPVDFSIWQAADGTWQLWSCIRNTNCGGNSRLFYRWESPELTRPDWEPIGVVMQADARFDETPGGLQAPHVVKIGDVYHMFYGDWKHICLQRSADGKTFQRWLYDSGRAGMFSQGAGANTRDAMAIKIGDLWHCYYCAAPGGIGAVYVRTSADLRNWSDARIVSRGGITGSRPGSAECPHVVALAGYYYLFRTQSYRNPPVTRVYRSRDPHDFGVDDDRCLLGILPVAAPEIIRAGNDWFIAALCLDVQGIRIARLQWRYE